MMGIDSIRLKINRALQKAGRSEESVCLVAVAKGQPVEKVREAIAGGLRDIGENYAQEMKKHRDVMGEEEVRWHFIGRLQRNKIRSLVGACSLIQTVDSIEAAREINRRAEGLGIVQTILVQINSGQEASKGGLSASPSTLRRFFSEISLLPHVDPKGLMTLPPYREDPEEARPYFRELKNIRDAINREALYKNPIRELSMGMTRDFETAIEEGATIVRIGTGIFGERDVQE